MRKLRKRLSVHDRVGAVTVIDMVEDPNAAGYLIYVFGKDMYLEICNQCHVWKHWIVVDEATKDYKFYESLGEVKKDYKNFDMFTKQDRSSFKYWFAHWCGFQIVALNLKCWKPKYLLHDIEKPWLKLFWNYSKVQKWHRTHRKHHLEYGLKHGWDAVDWMALMIDWECCGLSKQEAQLDARETLEYEIGRGKWRPYADKICGKLKPLLEFYDL